MARSTATSWSRRTQGLFCLLVLQQVMAASPRERQEAPRPEPPAASEESAEADPCRALLYVSVSPLRGRGRPERLAEVNWDFRDCDVRPARAVLFDHDALNVPPKTADKLAIRWSDSLAGAAGRLVTNYSVPRQLPGGWDRDSAASATPEEPEYCFDFRVALLDEHGALISSECLRIRPRWMRQLFESGGDNLALPELMLPGTHNSGSFPREGDDKDSHLVRYLLTQDLNTYEQLVWGVRYLDLRVGHYPQDMGDQQNESHPDHGERFWVNHDLVRVQPLRRVLHDVRIFLDAAVGEVVILDFHRFPVGFGAEDMEDTEAHGELLALIREVLGERLIPNERASALASIKDLHKRGSVLVAYGDRGWQQRERAVLWAAVPQLWGNQQSLEGLVEYLDRQVRAMYRVELHALMAELTPTVFDILLNLERSSLRLMADQVNWNITAHARAGYWFKFANIVAVDFVEGSDLVGAAVEANRWRSEHKRRHNEASRFSVRYCDGSCEQTQSEFIKRPRR